MENNHQYDDLLDLPHPVSSVHPRMSLLDRAAQFAPFAALTGFGEAITEAGRLTEQRVELGDAEIAELSEKLHILKEHESEQPRIGVTWFQADENKEGGRYVLTEGRLKQLIPENNQLVFTDGRIIDLELVICVEGEMFGDMGF